jgi:hypothetical protein
LGKQKANYYSGDMEATVPTPPDQQDVNALDMVSDVVQEAVDIFRDDIGLKDGKSRINGAERNSGGKSESSAASPAGGTMQSKVNLGYLQPPISRKSPS